MSCKGGGGGLICKTNTLAQLGDYMVNLIRNCVHSSEEEKNGVSKLTLPLLWVYNTCTRKQFGVVDHGE